MRRRKKEGEKESKEERKRSKVKEKKVGAQYEWEQEGRWIEGREEKQKKGMEM